jgi:hypothetical protein
MSQPRRPYHRLALILLKFIQSCLIALSILSTIAFFVPKSQQSLVADAMSQKFEQGVSLQENPKREQSIREIMSQKFRRKEGELA